MATSVALVKPTISLKDAYLSFYHEWLESGENMVPWVISRGPASALDICKLAELTRAFPISPSTQGNREPAHIGRPVPDCRCKRAAANLLRTAFAAV